MMLSYFSVDEDLKRIDDWNLDAIEVTLFDIVDPHLRCFHKATDVDARSPQRRTPILPDEAAQAEQSDIVCIMNVQTTQVSRFKATVDYLPTVATATTTNPATAFFSLNSSVN